MDWRVSAGNLFLAVAVVGLTLAPVAGSATAQGAGRGRHLVEIAAALTAALALLLWMSWRRLPGGTTAAVSGPFALIVALFALSQFGRCVRRLAQADLTAGLVGLVTALVVTVGPFAVGPLADALSPAQSRWLLAADPLLTAATAAGIDLLHLDLVYRVSPLAHRGIDLVAWPLTTVGHAILGLACYGASRIQPRSVR